MKPCDICIDPSCGGKKNCNCETCSSRELCPRLRGIKPTIRITRKCTQSCSHCLFECSPKSTEMMTLDMGQQVASFCKSNGIKHAEVMGGEFFLHPQWQQVLSVLGQDLDLVRLVTNADWAGNAKLASKVVDFLDEHREYYVGISRDRWHTNEHVDRAVKMLEGADILHRVQLEKEGGIDALIPLGRSRFESGTFFSMFAAACCRPDRKYSLLIDEEGSIFKCTAGAWPYANVKDFIDGGFAARFKDFNGEFYNSCLVNCLACQHTEDAAKRINKKNEAK